MAESIRLAIIVAAAANGVIGRNNALPWHLPEDLRHFRSVTMGKPIIMGRKTYASIGKPLPGRSNIVITRNAAFAAEGIHCVPSLQEAIVLAQDIARSDGVDEAVVIGGSEIYRLALPLANRLYYTAVHAQVAGDASLPTVDWSQWHEISREDHEAESPDKHAYSFLCFERASR